MFYWEGKTYLVPYKGYKRLIKELWSTLEAFGCPEYSISNTGKIRSHKYGKLRLIKTQKKNRNNEIVHIQDKFGNAKVFIVHRLVAQIFIPNPDNLPQVNHIDENPFHNWYTNLEWCTQEYNLLYSSHRISEGLKRYNAQKKAINGS